jgi:hypothetical protein
MSDSQPPNRPAPSFEVPDLELEPVQRSLSRTAKTRAATSATTQARSSAQEPLRRSSFDFDDDSADLGFESSAQATFRIDAQKSPRFSVREHAAPPAAEASWPTGRAAEAAELALDPLSVALLADYGEPPESAPLTLAYAYRVFTRQRELKHQLIAIAAECQQAQLEREATLSELARELLPALETRAEFQRFLAPLWDLEQRAAARGNALSASHTQLGARTGQFDAELSQIEDLRQTEERLERDAKRECDEREADAKRADAKWKRVQIEIRAVTHAAEQKLGSRGGEIPELEAARLSSLRERADALQPDVRHTRAELERATQALAEQHARLAALAQSERQISSKKRTMIGALQKQQTAHTQRVSEAENEQRAALAELARAVLAARGAIDVPEYLLERVRKVSDRADKLIVRAEMQRRAITAYDIPSAQRGIRLAGTAASLLLVLFALKLIF